MRRTSVKILIIAATAAATLWAIAASRRATAVVSAGPVAEWVAGPALVRAADGIAEVRARVAGRVDQVRVRVGDRVHAGDVLADVDPAELDVEVARLAAEVKAATAELDGLRAGAPRDVRRALRAEVRASKRRMAWAQRRQATSLRLVRAGAEAGDQVEEARAGVAQMEEELSQVMVRYHESRRGRPAAIAAAEARLESAQAALERARRERDRCWLRAPIDGDVLARRINPGDTLAGDGAVAFEIADVSRTELYAEIEDVDATRIAVGMSVVAVAPGGGRDALARARLTRLSPRLERRAIGVDDVRVRADGWVRPLWASWDGAPPALPLGRRLEIRVELPQRVVAARVPRAALTVEDGRALVRVPTGPFSREVAVTPGAADRDMVEVRGIAVGTAVRVE